MDKKPEVGKDNIPLHNLIKSCQEYIDFIDSVGEDYSEDGLDDFEHRIFETAVTAVYGREVWDWINKRQDDHYGKN